MREQIEPLEHHADLGALPGQGAILEGDVGLADSLLADEMPVDVDVALARPLDVVDAAQQRRLA